MLATCLRTCSLYNLKSGWKRLDEALPENKVNHNLLQMSHASLRLASYIYCFYPSLKLSRYSWPDCYRPCFWMCIAQTADHSSLSPQSDSLILQRSLRRLIHYHFWNQSSSATSSCFEISWYEAWVDSVRPVHWSMWYRYGRMCRHYH